MDFCDDISNLDSFDTYKSPSEIEDAEEIEYARGHAYPMTFSSDHNEMSHGVTEDDAERIIYEESINIHYVPNWADLAEWKRGCDELSASRPFRSSPLISHSQSSMCDPGTEGVSLSPESACESNFFAGLRKFTILSLPFFSQRLLHPPFTHTLLSLLFQISTTMSLATNSEG